MLRRNETGCEKCCALQRLKKPGRFWVCEAQSWSLSFMRHWGKVMLWLCLRLWDSSELFNKRKSVKCCSCYPILWVINNSNSIWYNIVKYDIFTELKVQEGHTVCWEFRFFLNLLKHETANKKIIWKCNKWNIWSAPWWWGAEQTISPSPFLFSDRSVRTAPPVTAEQAPNAGSKRGQPRRVVGQSGKFEPGSVKLSHYQII